MTPPPFYTGLINRMHDLLLEELAGRKGLDLDNDIEPVLLQLLNKHDLIPSLAQAHSAMIATKRELDRTP